MVWRRRRAGLSRAKTGSAAINAVSGVDGRHPSDLCGCCVTNREKGAARRAESGSFAKWMFERRKANLSEDIEVVSM